MKRVPVLIKKNCIICNKEMVLKASYKLTRSCSVECGEILGRMVREGKLPTKNLIPYKRRQKSFIAENNNIRSHQFMRILVDEPDRLL